MIELTNTEVFNFEGAFRGLRNPMNSWDKSDSYFSIMDLEYPYMIDDTVCEWTEPYKDVSFDTEMELSDKYCNWLYDNCILDSDEAGRHCSVALLGPNDMKLAQRMISGGPEEAKFLRQIFISVDINAPLFWWKEMDTYKVSTVANSCSTMHKLTSNEIGAQNFAFDSLIENFDEKDQQLISDIRVNLIKYCENLRQRYLETKDKRIWRALIEILPEAWLQKRTWTANYQVLRNIYFQRRNHKLQEWRDFCTWIESLPYGKELICYEKKEV